MIRDVLYVIDGRVATSAGIASGIDLALHLIAVRDGPATAARVAREMVVYARRNGDEQQASAMLRHRSHLSDTAHRAQDHIEARFAGPLPLAEIASNCGVSERTLTRKFTEATGLTPLRYQQLLRLERARAPDRPRRHRRGRRPHRRLPGPPHAPPPPRPRTSLNVQEHSQVSSAERSQHPTSRSYDARDPPFCITAGTQVRAGRGGPEWAICVRPADIAARCASLLTGADRQSRRTSVAGAAGQRAPMSP